MNKDLKNASHKLQALIGEIGSKQQETDETLRAAKECLPGLQVLSSLSAALCGRNLSEIEMELAKLGQAVDDFKAKWNEEFSATKDKMTAVYLDMVASRQELRAAIKTCDSRFIKLGKKGMHATQIRMTLAKNIHDRNWEAAEHNVEALLRLYDEFDEKKKQQPPPDQSPPLG